MIRDINKLVNIPGELNSPAEGNIVTWSKGVYDYPLEMDQQAINSHVYEIEDELDNIANEVNTINQSINEINSTNNRIITINQIDTLINGDLYKSTNPINYAVITPFISDNYKVGNLVLVSNDTGEKLVQIFATSLKYDNQNGTLNINNYDDNIVLIYRIYNNLTRVGQESGWTRWNYVNENITNESIKYTDQNLTGTQKMTVLSNIGLSIFDEINSSNLQNEPNQFGLTPGFPKRIPSLKAVWDLFKTIENTGLQKVSFENLNSLGDLEDTTTDKSSLYTIYNTDQYDQEYAEGLLFVYANLNEKLISQIVIGPYEITPNNHRTLRRISINTIGKFNILSRNRPYENASSRFSEWSVEDYIGYVKYNESQELTDSYKNTARENIGITIDDDTSDNEAVLLPDNSTGLPTSRYVQKALNALQNIIMTTITQSIDSVNSDINDLNDDVSENTTNINNINENITNINGNINDINGDINDINGDINSINENISNINNDVDSLTEQLDSLGNSITSYNLNKDVTTDNENNLIFANRYTADGSKNLVYLPENLVYQGIPYISTIVNGIYNNVYDDDQQVDNILEQSVIWDTNSRKFYLMVKVKPHQINQLINTIYYRNWPATGIYYSSDYYINNTNNQNVTFYVQDNNWGSQWGNDSHWIKIIGNQVQQAQAPNNLQSYNWISADTFEEENTIYVIRYNFNLKNTSASIGNNSVLRFEGGKLYNGTLIGNSSVYLDLNEAVSTQSMEVFSGNFANYGEEFPSNPYIGQTFYCNSSLFNSVPGLYYYNGIRWILLSELQLKLVNTLPVTGTSNSLYFNLTDNSAYIWSANKWNKFSSSTSGNDKGSSDNRPSNLFEEDEGYMYYDTTLHKPIFWSGEYWIDINGQPADEIIGTVSLRPINPDEDYSYFDSIDNKIIYAGEDEFGNITWSDSENNHYEVLEFNGFKNFDENETYDLIYNNVENDSVQVKCILYDNVHFFALNTNNVNYFNWTGEEGMYSSDYYQIQMSSVDDLFGRTSSEVVVRDKIHTTPYFLNTSNNKMYRYNSESHQLEEINNVYRNKGTFLQRPSNLPEEYIDRFRYYDTTIDKELIYNQDDCGNDLWLDSDGNGYNIIDIYGDYDTSASSIVNVTDPPDLPLPGKLCKVSKRISGPIPQEKLYKLDNRIYLSSNIETTYSDGDIILTGIVYQSWECCNEERGVRLSSAFIDGRKPNLIFHNVTNDKYYHYVNNEFVEV